MVPSEGKASLKHPVTPTGIDRGTVRLVAQRLNHYATSRPNSSSSGDDDDDDDNDDDNNNNNNKPLTVTEITAK